MDSINSIIQDATVLKQHCDDQAKVQLDKVVELMTLAKDPQLPKELLHGCYFDAFWALHEAYDNHTGDMNDAFNELLGKIDDLKSD